MANPGSSCSRRATPASSPRPPARRRRRTGPELRPTRGRSRTPSGGDVPGGHLSVPGCSQGMPNGNSTSERVRRGAGRWRTGTPTPSRCSPGAPASSSYSGTPLMSAPRSTWSAPGSTNSNRTMPRCRRGQVHAPAAPAPVRRRRGPRGSAPGEQLPPRDEYRPGAPGARDVGRPVPPGGSEFGTGTPGGVLGAADGVRASPGTVPSPGTSLAGTADWSLGSAAPGPAASVYRSRCGGDAGTGTRPPPAPGHRPVRPPRGPGELLWLPRGARSANGVGGVALPGAQRVLGSRS